MSKVRIKMHQMPGDYSKGAKIQMMENDPEFPAKQSKSFRKMIQARERAVLKERTEQEIEEEFDYLDYILGEDYEI